MNTELAELLATNVVVKRSDVPALAGAIDWARARRQIVSLLPGLYVAASLATDFRARVLAVCLADPDAVVFGEAAAVLHRWTEVREPTTISVASNRIHARPWLTVSRRHIAPERVLRRGSVSITDQELTAIDLAVATDGSSIDNALRRGASLMTLGQVASEVRRRGCVRVRRLLHESRDQPWSWAERRAHVLLRKSGILGWIANRPLTDAVGGLIAYGDLVFEDCGVVLEIDGNEWHLRPKQVQRDRRRDRRLSEQGWTVIRFSASDVTDDPVGFVATVQAVLGVSRALRGSRGGRFRLAA